MDFRIIPPPFYAENFQVPAAPAGPTRRWGKVQTNLVLETKRQHLEELDFHPKKRGGTPYF